jgi:dynein heavy chain
MPFLKSIEKRISGILRIYLYHSICESYEKISAKAMKIPNETEELVELMKYIENVKLKEIQELKEEMAKAKKRLDFLLTYSFMNEEDIKLNGVTFTWPSRILPIFDLSKKRLTQKKVKAQEDLKAKIEQNNADLDEIYDDVCKFYVSILNYLWVGSWYYVRNGRIC